MEFLVGFSWRLSSFMCSKVVDKRPTFRSSSNSSPSYSGVQDVFRRVYKEGGVRSLYRGVGKLLFRRIGSLLACSLEFKGFS